MCGRMHPVCARPSARAHAPSRKVPRASAGKARWPEAPGRLWAPRPAAPLPGGARALPGSGNLLRWARPGGSGWAGATPSAQRGPLPAAGGGPEQDGEPPPTPRLGDAEGAPGLGLPVWVTSLEDGRRAPPGWGLKRSRRGGHPASCVAPRQMVPAPGPAPGH